MTLLNRLALGASVIALGAGAATVSQAQTAASNAQTQVGELEQVVVTARRREEALQSVPVSVTAITGETLERKGVVNAFELARQVPNVIIAGASTNPALMTFGVRGLRQKEGHALFDQSVLTVFGEAVIAHSYGFGDVMYDLANIQVLKGPQGTLFGRNSTGGAIVIEPNLASVAEGFAGNINVSVGDYDRRKVTGVVNVPLGERAAFRVAADYFHRDGYVTNLFNGDKWSSVGNRSVRASLTLEPTDNLRNYTTVDVIRMNSAPYASIQVAFLPGGSGNLLGGPAASERLLAEQNARGPYEVIHYVGTNDALDLQRISRCAPGSSTPFQRVCNRADLEDFYDTRVWGVINRTELDIGSVTLKNIASFRHYTRETYQGSWNAASFTPPTGPGNVSTTGSPRGVDTFTNELQASGAFFQDRLDWATGAFYMYDHGHERNYSFQGIGAGVPTSTNFADTKFKFESLGIYGQGTLAVTDRFNLTGGLRWTKDDRRAEQGNVNVDVVTGVITCNIFLGETAGRLPANDRDCKLFGDKEWSAVTWTAAADYQVVEDTMVYASVSRGYRAGSFFPRAVRSRLFAYNPEYITSYEAGIKSEWNAGRTPVRTNLSAYQANMKDMQVQVQDTTSTPLSGFIANAASSQYQGVEFEGEIRPVPDMTVSGWVAYTDFKYKNYFDGATNLSYQTAPNPISNWAWGLTGTYHFDLGSSGTGLDLRADLNWTGKLVTDNRLPNAKGDPPLPSTTVLNLRADFTGLFGSPVDLGLWVTNVTDEFYSMGSTCLSGICYVVPSPPRMFGADLKYSFGG